VRHDLPLAVIRCPSHTIYEHMVPKAVKEKWSNLLVAT
jgi:hypothetical protein